jgi:hypothetical protein
MNRWTEVKQRLDLPGQEQIPVIDTCEYSNEHVGFIEDGDVLISRKTT